MSGINTSYSYLDSLRSTEEEFKVDDGSNQTLDQEDFLQLLTQQLAQQDPTEPVDNDQMITQMASFSTVEGISQMTEQFESLNSVMTSSQALQASSLVGQKVLIPTNITNKVAGEDVEAVISMPSNSNGDVLVRIENDSGELIRTINVGAKQAGNNEFAWDGLDEQGNEVEEGNYSINATATIDGENQELAVSTYSHVASVNLSTTQDGVILNLRGLGNISLSEVLAVADS